MSGILNKTKNKQLSNLYLFSFIISFHQNALIIVNVRVSNETDS